MGLAWGTENLPNIVIASNTSVTLAATNNGSPTTVIVGGQRYALTSTLTMSSVGTGAGGLDTGSLSTIQLWYVYVIVNSSTFAPALIASQAAPSTGPTMPSGYYAAWRLVGAFYTDGLSHIGSAVTTVGPAKTSWMQLNTSNNNSSNTFPVFCYGSTSGGQWTNVTVNPFEWMRDGNFVRVRGSVTCSATPAGATGGFELAIANFGFDTNDPTATQPLGGYIAGTVLFGNGTSSNAIIGQAGAGAGGLLGGNFINVSFVGGANTSPFQSQPANSIPRAWVAGDVLNYDVYAPVLAWTGKPTLL